MLRERAGDTADLARRPARVSTRCSPSRHSHRRATANASSGNAARAPSSAVHHLVHERLVLEAVAALARPARRPRARRLGARQRAERCELGEDARREQRRDRGAAIRKSSRTDSTTGIRPRRRCDQSAVATWACVSGAFNVKDSSNWSKTTQRVAVGLAPASQHSEPPRPDRRTTASCRSACEVRRRGPRGRAPARAHAAARSPACTRWPPSPRAAPEARRHARTRSCLPRKHGIRASRRPRANPLPERDDFLLAPEEHRRVLLGERAQARIRAALFNIAQEAREADRHPQHLVNPPSRVPARPRERSSRVLGQAAPQEGDIRHRRKLRMVRGASGGRRVVQDGTSVSPGPCRAGTGAAAPTSRTARRRRRRGPRGRRRAAPGPARAPCRPGVPEERAFGGVGLVIERLFVGRARARRLCFERPKSRIFTAAPSGARNRFSGLRSRCTMPLRVGRGEPRRGLLRDARTWRAGGAYRRAEQALAPASRLPAAR